MVTGGAIGLDQLEKKRHLVMSWWIYSVAIGILGQAVAPYSPVLAPPMTD